MEQDIRWLQRYDSFHRACGRVLELTESNRRPQDLSELEMEGLVQRFEYTFELAWKVLQDFLRYKGYEGISGPNPVLKRPLKTDCYLIMTHGEEWQKLEIRLLIYIMRGKQEKLLLKYMMSIRIF